MVQKQGLGSRWEAYQPSKTAWFWSCVGAVVATMIVGFAWGGWVTGGTANKMVSEAADGARAQLAATSCVTRFNAGPDAVAQLAALKGASSYSRSGMIERDGWATMAGSANPVSGAADLCAQTLVSAPVVEAPKG
jgi:hypothetical protein